MWPRCCAWKVSWLAGWRSLTAMALLFDGRHHRLQAIDQGGISLGLLLQQLERLLALMVLRIDAQGGGDLRVEQLHGLQSLAPAQRGKQPQHRRAWPRRRSRCRTQSPGPSPAPPAIRGWPAGRWRFPARCRCRAASPSCPAACRACQAAPAGPTRYGVSAGTGQGHALAFDAQARGVAQAGMQIAEPADRAGWRRGQVRHGPRERRGGLAIAMQLDRASEIAGADQQRDGRAQRIRTDVADADPAHGDQADQRTPRDGEDF